MDSLLVKKADELARELGGSTATLDDLQGMLRSLMKTVIEAMLNSEKECASQASVGRPVRIDHGVTEKIWSDLGSLCVASVMPNIQVLKPDRATRANRFQAP